VISSSSHALTNDRSSSFLWLYSIPACICTIISLWFFFFKKSKFQQLLLTSF
jgi:hypothetical protein